MTFGPEECCFDSKAMAEKGVAEKEAGMDWVHHRCHPREQATEIQRGPQALKHSLEAVQIGLTECLARSTVSCRECVCPYTTFPSL